MCSTKPWLDILSTVMLGLRMSFKEDIQTTPAELVYGTGLRMPGEFFVDNVLSTNLQFFIEKHQEIMREIKPSSTALHAKNKIFVLRDLDDFFPNMRMR